jgi:Mrp family chromosome partitioning ATPase
MIGSGTVQDPYRPLFSPTQQAAAQSGSGNQSSQIIAFQSVPTDDGKAAIVVFVARSYAAFAPILQDARVIRSFQRSQWTAGDLITELQKYKKNFDLKMLRVGAL